MSEDSTAWVTREEAMELTGLSERTLYRKIAEESWATRQSGRSGSNGRPIPEIAVSSLPQAAQALYWTKHIAPSLESSSNPLNLAEIPEPLRVEARRRRAIVEQAEEILSGPHGLRDEALEQFCRERDLSVRTVYRWRSLYQQRGAGALLPKWGKTRGQFLALSTPIQHFIKDEYCSPQRPSPTTVYRMTLRLCAKLNEPAPSQATVNRYLLTLPQPAVVLAREGAKAFRAKMEPKTHRDLSACAPNEVWCGDHREFDVFVKTHDGPDAKIVRPWVTCWYDLGTRTWVGRHVAIVPNSDTIALALRTGILRFGVPQELYIDNGKDFRCHYLNGSSQVSRNVGLSSDLTDTLAPGVLSPLGVLVRHANPYQAWSKPIEPAFKHVFTEWEKTLPGWCGRNAIERPEKLKREIERDELLTIEEFTAKLDARIDEYHHQEHSVLGSMPLAAWRGAELLKPSPRTLDLLLMRQKSVKVYTQGIKFQGRYYWHDELALQVGHSVEIRFGAELGRIVVFTDGKFLCEALNDPALRMGATREDLAELHRRKKSARKRAEQVLADRGVLLRPERELERIAAQARERKVVALPSPPPSTPSGAQIVAKMLPHLDHAAAALAQQETTPSPTPHPAQAKEQESTRYDLLEELLAEG
ncbi:MAG: Mu transposase C-terminal domain-containing protein [Nitrospira sp.]|nr:Mu transposase C-terminal domain-containing protein [Nitrospira sp.]